MNKKILLKLALTGIGTLFIGYVMNLNRRQAGIILNQQHTIDGLLRDVKNLSYHLGKRQ